MKLSTAGRTAGIVAMLVAALTAPGAGDSVARVASQDFPVVAVAVVQLAALLMSGWVLLVLAAGVVQIRVPGVPGAVRALLFTAVVVVAVAGPAQADSAHHLDGLALPDRPTNARTVTTTAPVTSGTVAVRTGDSLWSIAADHLPAGSSTTDVAGAVSRWYAINRGVIGSDPDLIRPGQVLASPTAEQDAP